MVLIMDEKTNGNGFLKIAGNVVSKKVTKSGGMSVGISTGAFIKTVFVDVDNIGKVPELFAKCSWNLEEGNNGFCAAVFT